MKHLNKRLLFCILIAVTVFSSCSKSGNAKPQNTTNLSALNGIWSVPAWGGVANNTLAFVIQADSTTGVVSQIGSNPFGFAVGDKIFTNIAVSGTGTYSCTGKYTYGTNSTNSSTRSAVMTLQNNNTQLTVDYPAINSSFPEIIYIYQKTTTQ